MTTRVRRVVSVPAGHPYPRAIRAEASAALVVVPDPDPVHRDRPAGEVWWPHPGLEPAWLATQTFDLLHLHFGFDHRTPAELAELVDHLRDRGRPLVLTVHDLRSPHQADTATLDRQLDVLVPAAAAVLTLTDWAAGEIRRRWGRTAQVSPHPPLVAVDDARRLRARRTGPGSLPGWQPVVAVSAKSLRANCDPVRLLPALEQAASAHDARLRVLVHTKVVSSPESGTQRRAAAAFADARARGVEVVVHEPLSDDALWAELAGQDVAVLPYRFGTHSGWLEACHDVGTHVAAPDFGGYASQGADASYAAGADDLDPESLVGAVGDLVERARSGVLAGEEPEVRAQRGSAAAVLHERVYADALERR